MLNIRKFRLQDEILECSLERELLLLIKVVIDVNMALDEMANILEMLDSR